MYRQDLDDLTVRSCSTNFSSGGTVYNVTGYSYHESFNLTTFDYDVAILRVCTDFNMGTYIAIYIYNVLAVTFSFVSFFVPCNVAFVICSKYCYKLHIYVADIKL
jgi:hypothetical protein